MRIEDEGSVALLFVLCAVSVDRGSKMRIEDEGSVALLFALCEREREGKRVRTLK